MSDIELWKMFEKTGSINDYLNYACTCESGLEEPVEQGVAGLSENEEVECIE